MLVNRIIFLFKSVLSAIAVVFILVSLTTLTIDLFIITGTKDINSSDNLPYAYCEQIGKEIRDISDEIPFDIPDSWEWCRLGAIFQHNTGKALNSSNHQGTKMTYITTSNLYWDRFELDKLKEMPFTDSEVEKCTVKKGDLLVCEGGDIGRAAIWNYDYPMRIQNHIHRLRSYSEVDVYYFYYIFFLYKSAGLIGGKGIGIQGLSSNALDKLLLPVPPLEEQHRIVAKIDELLPYIEKYGKAEEHLTALNTTFSEALKKSILQEAVQGKLVPQNPDDEPASVLLERIRAEKQALIKAGKIKKDKHESVIVARDKIPYEIIDGKERYIADEVPFELPESWCWCRISNLFSVGTGMTPLKSEDKYYKNATVPWVNSSQTSQRYIKDVDTHITEYALENNSLVLYEPHTLIVAMYGQGKTRGQVSELLIPATVNQACAALTAITYSQDMIEYVYYFFVYNYEIMRKKAEGTSQPNLNIQKIKDIILPLPPLAEQKRIVEKIEELMQYCDKL